MRDVMTNNAPSPSIRVRDNELTPELYVRQEKSEVMPSVMLTYYSSIVQSKEPQKSVTAKLSVTVVICAMKSALPSGI
jgi:hypothetical protein